MRIRLMRPLEREQYPPYHDGKFYVYPPSVVMCAEDVSWEPPQTPSSACLVFGCVMSINPQSIREVARGQRSSQD
eukprot:4088941-Alexandrium_andersonii.AAC.1